MVDPRPLKGMYHAAFAARDAEETRHFYEDILGLPLVNCMMSEKVPSTGEETPYLHFFFELGDGSYIAFFDLGGDELPAPSLNTPSWVQHFAIETDSVENVAAMQRRLEDNGVECIGVVDHGFIKSVYFFDPNGLRLEITTRTEPEGYIEEEAARAHDTLKTWNERKKKALAEA